MLNNLGKVINDLGKFVFDFRINGFVDVDLLTYEELRDLLNQYDCYQMYRKIIVDQLDIVQNREMIKKLEMEKKHA